MLDQRGWLIFISSFQKMNLFLKITCVGGNQGNNFSAVTGAIGFLLDIFNQPKPKQEKKTSNTQTNQGVVKNQ